MKLRPYLLAFVLIFGADAMTTANIFSDTLLFVPQGLILPWFLAALGSEDGMTPGRSARGGGTSGASSSATRCVWRGWVLGSE